MITLFQQFYFFILILTCRSSENEYGQPMSGFYTDGLDHADKIEIVYPEKVSKDGAFVSYYIPHYYNLETLENRPKRKFDGSEDFSDNAIHFFVPIEGQKHHLELWPNQNFLAPGLVIEKRDARDVDNINKAKMSQISQKQCHYSGRIVGKPDSRVALSTCYGLAGYIQLPAGDEYFIEPVKDSKPTFNHEHPHIMYKRSGSKERHSGTNCLTKGLAKDALGERLQWESLYGSQVRKEFSPINMNDLMRESLGKSVDTMNTKVDTNMAESFQKEGLVKLNQDKPDEVNLEFTDSPHSGLFPGVSLPESVNNSPPKLEIMDKDKFEESKKDGGIFKLVKISTSSNPQIENDFEGNMKQSLPKHDDTGTYSFDKFARTKLEYGNKLKQKPLKDELGSIKLPDSPLKPSSNQLTDGEHFMRDTGPPIKKIYEPGFGPKRDKKEIRAEHENNNKYSSEEKQPFQKNPSKSPVKNEYSKAKGEFESDVGGNEYWLPVENKKQAKRDTLNMNYDSSVESKIVKTADDKTKQLISDSYADVKNKNNQQVNGDTKHNSLANDQTLNPESLTNKVDQKYPFINDIESNVKRDIHLDTSEKSWQTGENSEKYLSNSKLEMIDNIYDLNSQNKLAEENFLDKDLESNTETKILRGGKSKTSKDKKTDSQNDDIMVSAIESVVRDLDKTKVKKDTLGGFSAPPLAGGEPGNKPILINPKSSNIDDSLDMKDMKLETPSSLIFRQMQGEQNAKTIEKGSNAGSDAIKVSGSEGPTEVISEPKQPDVKLNENHAEEIIIRIKTPEGTVSEVKQNSKTDSEKNNAEPLVKTLNPTIKDSVISQKGNLISSETQLRTKDLEKGKRGTEPKSESLTKNEKNSKNANDFPTQDINIVLEAPQQSNIKSESYLNNKVKRDENSIHLVIETEPEVKNSEGQSSDTPGSNLFCQGRNCLEIKPVYLNDSQVSKPSSTIGPSLTTGVNNTNSDNNHKNFVRKRDAEEDSEEDGTEYPGCDTTTTESPLKCHDFLHKIFTIELMVTVDFKVVQMHEDDDIENFILTIINMVSSNFDDKSIGLNINIVLVRLILLTTCIKELDSERFNPEELLENFCTWQVLINPGRDDHPHHHDLAIYVAKMEKCEGEVMGVSYMTSVCRPDKACVIVVDEGLLLANTITHQIGHSLGADHDDGQSSQCAPSQPDGTSFFMAPKISETSSAWSPCSRDAIVHFVQTQGSWCLLDFPIVRHYNFPLMLPGQVYSAAQQCKLNFHMTAIPCSVGAFCNKLYCQITDKLCATKGDPPADGTFCAANMWCFHKQCVHVGRRPGAINGEWGPWTEWSLCTRSCGGGVSSSYRICNNPKPENGGRFCIGERIRHKMCQTKPCQGFLESFRDLQCKRTEDRPFRGKVHNWIQYQSLFINIECALVCQNRRGDVVMRSPIVADGTPCKAGTPNVCIQGICRNVGCDYVIDSTAKEDACGVCHGNGTECKIIQGIFDEAMNKKGLIEFLRIPKESGMIFVREIAPSSNTLVVSGAINKVFYLNGLGSEDSMSGDITFGMVHGTYEKRGGMERVFIRGPTKEDLIFYVLFRDVNKGIHYQYATLDVDHMYIPRYLWQYLDWDTCSDPCSGGSQRARAKCVEDRGGVVDDKYCLQSTRPMDIIRPCNDFPCQAKWWVSVWSDCICTGATNVMFRSVLCMRANDESGTRVEVVKESECLHTRKPPTQKPCNYTEDDTSDCAKRSISDDSLFHTHSDLRRAVNPILAFSEYSPLEESEGSESVEPQISQEQPFSDSQKESVQPYKHVKKAQKGPSKGTKGVGKKTGLKGKGDKDMTAIVLDNKQVIDKKPKFSPEKIHVSDKNEPIEITKKEDKPKEASKNDDEIMETSKNEGKLAETSKNKDEPMEESISEDKAMETSKNEDNLLEMLKNKETLSETFKNEEKSMESLKNEHKLLETSKIEGKPIEKSPSVENENHKSNLKSEDTSLIQGKGKQLSKLNQKNNVAPVVLVKDEIAKQAPEEDLGGKDYEGKGVSEITCESSTTPPVVCETEEEISFEETETTCKNTCAPVPHKKTTCCKTSPHAEKILFVKVKTTLETTTLRPVPVKLDELNVNNFALTVVPLEYFGKTKELPQSDPEFINLGAIGQFGVADELNATIISGQEALDLLDFARSNASAEPVILHEDMNN